MNALFYSLLVLLVWVPLPFASNRQWAWALMVLVACLLGTAWLIGLSAWSS
jgi:predicted RND superfamily exporter protein